MTHVETIRAGFAAHNRGDVNALVELYAPEAVFETLLLGTHHGNESIRVIYAENQKTMSGYDVIPVELIEARQRGRSTTAAGLSSAPRARTAARRRTSAGATMKCHGHEDMPPR